MSNVLLYILYIKLELSQILLLSHNMDTFTVSVRLKFLLSIFLLKLNYPLEVLNGLLSKGAIPLYTLNDRDPMFF